MRAREECPGGKKRERNQSSIAWYNFNLSSYYENNNMGKV